MLPNADFPNLTANNHRITSSSSHKYNCVAWSAGDTEHWWQPGVYWPTNVPAEEYGIGILEQAKIPQMRVERVLEIDSCER
jgi:hypothetical protein